MFRIVQTLIKIRLRKFLPKDDLFAIALLFFAYGFISFLIFKNFTLFKNYSFIFSLEILLYHSNRKDLDLLRMSKKYYIILFLEYFIYSFPIIVVLILKLEYFYVVIYLILIVLYVIFPRTKTNKTNYPFQLFDPFWHISFRKYKLILLLPIALFLVIMGKIYSNQNLSIAAIIIASIIASLPSFERESKEQIKMSFYQTKHYLLNQIKISFINTSYLLVPIALAILFCQQWQLLIYLILIFVLPIINILFKYSCFSNPFSHQIFALLFLGTVVYGIPLLILPFLYFKSIKNLEIIQNVTN